MILKVGKVKKTFMEVKFPHLIQTGKMLIPSMYGSTAVFKKSLFTH